MFSRSSGPPRGRSSPLWLRIGPAPLVLRPAPALAGPSGDSAGPSRPPALASVSSSLPGSPSAQASCLATLQRFTRAAGFSSAVAEQSLLARRPSSRAVYQVRWSIYRSWCHDHGHSVSRPTLAKVADFLYWLQYTRGLSVSSLSGYRSVLSAVFRFHLPSLSSDPVIWDLLRSFRPRSAERMLRPPAWDLSKVLTYLVSPAFEPLSQAPFRALTLKTLFLLALATAKRVGELQVLSSIVTFVGGDACLSYIPQFVAKSELLTRSIPRSFLVKSLADFAAGLDIDLLLCPVRALRLYLLRARSLSPCRHHLFISPRCHSHAMSKNAVSFFLREVISAAGAARPQLDPSGLMKSAACPHLSRSTVTGRFPLSLSQPLGPPVRCFLLSIYAISNTSMMACFLWVHSWLRVLG